MPKKKSVWEKAVAASADPARATHYYNLLKPHVAKAGDEQARILSALFSGSPASADLLVKHPDWIELSLQPDLLRNPRREEGMRREVQGWQQSNDALANLRLFKSREMVRIAARDLGRLADLPQTVGEISAVADVVLTAVLQVCRARLQEKHGIPYHLDANEKWQETEFTVIGLGKLGGQELNYSSDIDVTFVYSEEGYVFKEPPRKVPSRAMTNHQFFKRLVEAFIAETMPSMYRVDLRLRPEGDSGPLARSLASYENFYAQWGQAWERMMLIKARGVAGDAGLAAEFVETVQPFRYPRSLSEGFLREIAAMKDRIEVEVVKAGEIDRNVKLGRGGIREIEFAAQSLQVIHGGRLPFLQTAQTLTALQKLVQYHLLDKKDSDGLSEAYCFLRDLEHRLQMENYLQTHTIPAAPKSRERLAALLGFEALAAFERKLSTHTQCVRRVYEKLFKSEQQNKGAFPQTIQGAEDEWKRILKEHSFRDPEHCLKLLAEFAMGPGFVHVSPRTVELAWQLIAKFLTLCKQTAGARQLSDPDQVLTRLDTFIAGYGSRALLFETWTSNPQYFELMLLLFDRSEFLAEAAIRIPDLVDGLVVGGRLRRRKTAEEILVDLRHGHKDQDQIIWLRRYHQAELMRIGLRDILGLADFEQNLLELSALAEACLQYALEAVMRKHKLKTAPFVIVGLGKLGGREISYGSDLDVLFVAEDKVRDLPRLQRIALEVLEMISAPTELGVAFPTDTRLRPDGEKGLIVNALRAYEEYYQNRAQLWEIQALSRNRPVAGHPQVGERFSRMAARLTDFRDKTDSDWKKQIAKMRQRIEKERTPHGQDALAIKTGSGGLMDAEFIAQTFCMEHGVHEPNTLRALELAQGRGWLPDGAVLMENYKQLRRVEGILRRWSYAGETVLPDDPAPQYRVAVRCGWRSAPEFLKAVGKFRRAIRDVYLKVFA